MRSDQGDLFEEIYMEGHSRADSGKRESKPSFERFLLSFLLVLIISVLSYVAGFKSGVSFTPSNKCPAGIEENDFPDVVVVEKCGLGSPRENGDGNPIVVNIGDRDEESGSGKGAGESAGIAGKDAISEPEKYFTVQLASYKSKKYCDLESKRLIEEGYDSFCLKKGKFYILCCGRCGKKDAAQSVLREIIKKNANRYPGAYVRRVTK